MRLKSIDIQGFKSFPDRTRLDFDDGITAVIGPNGSGKSNIADAVRWVLGEQSTRALRGGRMEDVIFGGTQTRKAQGSASVTLVIDNADKSLPIEADEVAVGRRLYRSGESEYRINGAQVRLKDVSELFMDTGLGRDGYSIIGQGRISEIVSARSKERREIFEEAAGISKFRYRKTEAERRLELAETNMVRLRDILAELDGRIGPLKSQAHKAQKYLDLAAEKKKLEVSVWMQSLAALQARAAALEDRLLLSQAELEQADGALALCGQQFSAEMERGRLLMVQIEEKRAASSRLSEQVTLWESQAAVLQNDIGHHMRTIAGMQEDVGQAGRSQEELKAEIEASRALADDKMQRLAALARQSGELSGEMAKLEEQQQVAAAALEQLRLRRAGIFEAIEAAKLDAAASATLLGESRTRLDLMQQTQQARRQAVETARQECGECEALLAEIGERELSLKNTADGYLRKRQVRSERLAAMDQSIAALERRAQERQQRASLLSDMDKNMEGFGQGVRHIMAQVRAGVLSGVHGPVSSLLSVDDEHLLAIETALGGALQNIVVDDEQTGKRAIGMLRSSRAGRATFLPLTAVKGNRLTHRGLESTQGFVGLACDLVRREARYDGVVLSLLGHIAVAEDLDSAVELAGRYGYRFRVVTLDGQVVNAGGSMTGGYAARSAGILGRRREIEQLTRQAEEILAERDELAGRRQSAARELSAIQAEIDALEAQQKVCAEDRIRCREQLSAAGQRLSQAEAQQQELAREHRLLTERIEEIKRKSGSSDELTERLSAELDEFQREIAQGAEAREATAALMAELAARQAEHNTQTTLLEHELAAARQEQERLAGLVSTGEEQRAGLLGKIAALQDQIQKAESDRAGLLEMAAQGKNDIQAAQGEVLAAMQERQKSEQHCGELRAKEREETSRRDGLYRETARLAEQKSAAESEHGTLVARLYDEYELTRSDAEAVAEPLDDPPAANRRLSELRAAIRGLGAVNVEAIEEYAEVSARQAALSGQMRDIERSKAELTRLIGDLTGRMRDIFSEKFVQINRHFGKIFSELFEGGSASLSLTDPDDLLESGIEISVHPPGKLIKNLAALSGGEQAFVAIAIFFAILRVNPSPFCVMDEIEAALDDVNVGKFAAYLRTLTDKTQFIAITHRRGTMEAADVLYGVAMQEEGVSRLLQLKVTEIEKRLGIR